jgi:hypothetical protein
MTRFQLQFRAVFPAFFPRWKAAGQWRCTTLAGSAAYGTCDEKRKFIEIGLVSDDDDALDLLLTHEISHAVAPPDHGTTWQGRAALAASLARRGRPTADS